MSAGERPRDYEDRAQCSGGERERVGNFWADALSLLLQRSIGFKTYGAILRGLSHEK